MKGGSRAKQPRTGTHEVKEVLLLVLGSVGRAARPRGEVHHRLGWLSEPVRMESERWVSAERKDKL